MRDLAINQKTIFYSVYGVGESTDKYGNPKKGYGQIKSMKLCVSASKGEPSEDIFGNDLKYDRTMTTHNTSCDIDEFTRIWIDAPTDGPHNYIVKSVSKSYSSIKYAIEKVDITYENKNQT